MENDDVNNDKVKIGDGTMMMMMKMMMTVIITMIITTVINSTTIPA